MKHQVFSAQQLNSSTAQQTKSDLFRFLKLSIQSFTVLMIVLFVSSCQDDNVTKSHQLSPNISERLESLYRQKKNPETALSNRDGGKLSVNDALDYLNEGMNFLYCRPNDFFMETKVFKDTFSIAIDGSNEVEAGDLNDLMDEIADFAGSYYYSDARNKKEPLMFDMNEVGSPSPSYINIEATFAFEAGSPVETTDEYPYDDSWIYGQYEEDVSSECSTEEANVDAADLLRRDLRKNVTYRNNTSFYYLTNPYVVCFSGSSNDCFAVEIPYDYFPTDIAYQGDDLLNENDVTHSDNLYDYLIFQNYSGFSGFHECISPAEMNFYYDDMVDMANGILPSPTGNKVIGIIEVGYDNLWPGTKTVFHSMLVVRVDKNPIAEEEYEEGLELPHP